MLKYLVILLIILGFALIVARHDEYASLKSAQEAANKDNPALAGKPDENHSHSHEENSAWDSPGGHIFHNAFRWPDGITVWAIILTLMAITEQASEAGKATKAMRKSIEVQEAEFLQWVDIGDWEVEEQPASNQRGWGRSGTNIQGHPGAMKFRISFPLHNNTPRPLYIHSVRTELVIGSEKIKREFLTKESLLVPPKSAYTTVIDTELTYDNVTEWLTYSVPILAAVDVSFSNAIGKKEMTRFERLVTSRWGPDGGTRTVSKGHKAEQQAN